MDPPEGRDERRELQGKFALVTGWGAPTERGAAHE